jgi:hypothetical protein
MALPEREETTRDWLREQLRQQSFCGSPKCDPVQPAADHGPDTRAGVGSILRPDRDRSRKYCQGRKCGTRHRSTNGPSIRRNLPCQVRRSAPRAMGTASRPSTPSLSARWFRRPKRRPRAVGAPSLINGRWRPSRFRPLSPSRRPVPGAAYRQKKRPTTAPRAKATPSAWAPPRNLPVRYDFGANAAAQVRRLATVNVVLERRRIGNTYFVATSGKT